MDGWETELPKETDGWELGGNGAGGVSGLWSASLAAITPDN